MSYSPDFARTAREHVYENAPEIMASTLCCCHFCKRTFPSSNVIEWLNPTGDGRFDTGLMPTSDKAAAFCPVCKFDYVIGDASGLPIADPEFWEALDAVVGFSNKEGVSHDS